MASHLVDVRGSGRAVVIAYGFADAEHQVEKELARLLDGVSVEVTAVERRDEGRRIAEEFDAAYRLALRTEVDAPSAGAARREALRRARQRLDGSRYANAELWVPPAARAAP